MKALPLLLAVAGLTLGAAQAGTVVLIPNDVINGIQINAAIDRATNFGREPGRVVFDGQNKGFTCVVTEDVPDVSELTYIQYSNVQLVGINGANTGDGICNVVIADAPLQNILIEGLRIADYTDDGVGLGTRGLSVRRNVTIRKNDITGSVALQAFNATNWKIHNNTIRRARDTVVHLFGAQGVEFIGNTVDGFPGLLVAPSETRESTGNRIIANRFSASRSIDLRGAASGNIVALNRATECPVVMLGSDTTRNRVLFNRAPSAACGELNAVEDEGSNNQVAGNRP